MRTGNANHERTLLRLLSQIDECLNGLNEKFSVLIELESSNSNLTFSARFALPRLPSLKPEYYSAHKAENEGK